MEWEEGGREGGEFSLFPGYIFFSGSASQNTLGNCHSTENVFPMFCSKITYFHWSYIKRYVVFQLLCWLIWHLLRILLGAKAFSSCKNSQSSSFFPKRKSLCVPYSSSPSREEREISTHSPNCRSSSGQGRKINYTRLPLKNDEKKREDLCPSRRREGGGGGGGRVRNRPFLLLLLLRIGIHTILLPPSPSLHTFSAERVERRRIHQGVGSRIEPHPNVF